MSASSSPASPLLLCILDGVGYNPDYEGNAVRLAKAPTLARLFKESPWTFLTTHGEVVGLPAGQMGNSEVGHLTIGSGRTVRQWLTRVTGELSEGTPQLVPAWKNFVGATSSTAASAQSNHTLKSAVHLIGLFSTGGVHSHAKHLIATIRALCDAGETKIVLHLISDGRDVPPTSFESDLKGLISTLPPQVSVGSVAGRFFAMDRDKRPERTEAYYNLLCAPNHTAAIPPDQLVPWIQAQYTAGVTDEFLPCTTVTPTPLSISDRVLFWNFREDRMRQICAMMTAQPGHPSISWYSGLRPVVLPANQVLCFTDYDPSLNLPVLFPPDNVRDTLGDCISAAGLTQIRCAETEKYPHVTYFFNGKREDPLNGEERILVPSPRDVKTYDQKPAMSAVELTDAVLTRWRSEAGFPNLTVLNFANCDMVGHTGVLSAAVAAVEAVDTCLGRLLDALNSAGGKALIFADHGNSELMVDYRSGEACTTHTTFPVPCFAVGFGSKTLRLDGSLRDIAPTALEALGVPVPSAMTGTSLFR